MSKMSHNLSKGSWNLDGYFCYDHVFLIGVRWHSVFENAIDMAHIHYLHNDTFGNQGQPEIRGMSCSSNAYGVEAHFRLHNKPVSALWEFSKVGLCLLAGPPVRNMLCDLLTSTVRPCLGIAGYSCLMDLRFLTHNSG